jgi:tetratricopeptide (TPR) repeat protein
VNDQAQPFFLQALDKLKGGDRRAAAELIERELGEGNTSARNLASVAQLAVHIGEIELAIDAMRRSVVPGSIDTLLAYWAMLANHGRSEEALDDIRRQSAALRDHPAVLHFRAMAATQFGSFDEAQDLLRRALSKAPTAMQSWFALAMIKTFTSGDPDIDAMERLERQAGAPTEPRAALCYALGKAAEDCGDIDRAFGFYTRGAALRRQQGGFDAERFHRAVDEAIRDFTPDRLAQLKPSAFQGLRSLFVTGLPRSGTTLTEQILRGHSAVVDGAEVNLFSPALISMRGQGMDAALAYQQQFAGDDPWGEIGRDYARLIDIQFPSAGLVVDKSLGQSLLTGLMLHALPEARIAWLRRLPDDVALSCFRTYFSMGLPWTWSLIDIAERIRAEDRLFDHWRAAYPERILVVPYEELVASPGPWADRLQRHFGLPVEPGLEKISRDGRAVRTASVGQVRETISTDRIGRAAAFERHLKPFRDLYYD